MELVYTKDGKAIMSTIQVARAIKMRNAGHMSMIASMVKKGSLDVILIDGKKWITLESVEKFMQLRLDKARRELEAMQKPLRSFDHDCPYEGFEQVKPVRL